MCTYSNLPVIRPAVKGKFSFFSSSNSSTFYITFIFAEKKKVMNYTAIQMMAWICITYLSVYLLHTKMVCLECKPGTVNTALTMLGSHPPSSPFSEQSFCADSIFLLMLLNRWLQLAVGENLWNKQMPPEITVKPIIYVGGGKTTLHQKDIVSLLLTLTFNYIIFLFCWKKCRCVWIQI